MWWYRLLRALAIGLAMMVIGCAHPISAPLRQQARKDLTLPKVIQAPGENRGSIVIWGGAIQAIENRDDGSTTLQIKEYPLDWTGEPNAYVESGGEFMVHTPQYLDPTIYERGRWITMGGELIGVRITQTDTLQYRYPEVVAREIHLWQIYPEVYVFSSNWSWNPPYDDYGFSYYAIGAM